VTASNRRDDVACLVVRSWFEMCVPFLIQVA
jgi:hypothetical protein